MPAECLEGYVHMLEILVTKYGIPENIYCDRHTILISPKDGNLTNFGHMCEDLGINSSIPGTVVLDIVGERGWMSGGAGV